MAPSILGQDGGRAREKQREEGGRERAREEGRRRRESTKGKGTTTEGELGKSERRERTQRKTGKKEGAREED